MGFWAELKEAFADRPWVTNDLTIKAQLGPILSEYYDKYNCSAWVDMSVKTAFGYVLGPRAPARLKLTLPPDAERKINTMSLEEWTARKAAACTTLRHGEVGPAHGHEADVVCEVLGYVALGLHEKARAIVEAYKEVLDKIGAYNDMTSLVTSGGA